MSNRPPLNCIWLVVSAVWFFLLQSASALEPWQAALAQMPLKSRAVSLTKTNTVPLLLNSFQKNSAAKALIIMPGATDELFFFDRVQASLTNNSPSLLDAITALTNQTLIEVTFRAPFILVHSAEDPLEPLAKIQDERTAERIRKKKFKKSFLSDDRDWEGVQPTLEFYSDTTISPAATSPASYHFFRHFFVAHELTAWEAMEATALAGKSIFMVKKREVIFEPDTRFRKRPTVPVSVP